MSLTGKFSLGRIVATRSVAGMPEVQVLIARHASGDWGVVCEEDKQANEDAIRDGDRILSAYDIGGERLYVITEADRSSTTVLKADEY